MSSIPTLRSIVLAQGERNWRVLRLADGMLQIDLHFCGFVLTPAQFKSLVCLLVNAENPGRNHGIVARLGYRRFVVYWAARDLNTIVFESTLVRLPIALLWQLIELCERGLAAVGDVPDETDDAAIERVCLN